MPTPRLALMRASLTGLTLALATAAPAHAADSEPPPPPPKPKAAAMPAASPLAPARAHIKAKDWPAAIAELRRVNAVNDADWNNLLGYALRKQATPDLDGAQRYYDAALRINPQHLGALEYSGELALMRGDLPTAEGRLTVLTKLCPNGCEELADLKQAVARFKTTGKL
jgi:tetratricopeptide (TPR) repeat protein